jgi:glucose-6-phosphate isomerase
MQLPDEALSYQYQGLLFQPSPDAEWRPHLELQAQHFLSPQRLKALTPQLLQIRSQVAAEREITDPAPALRPLDAGFINLPEKLLNELRKHPKDSELSRIQATAAFLREQTDRVVILGIGGSSLGARALFGALKSAYHNELPPEARLGVPRIYFEGDHVDNDALHDLLELLQTTCLNPAVREDRWATVVISKSGKTLETAAAYRVLRREAVGLYGAGSEWLRRVIIPVTGTGDSRLRRLFAAEGYEAGEIFDVPDRVGGRFSVFSAVGLLPAAIMGLDIRALLQGAASMTKEFLEHPFERNTALQFAGVNYLLTQERNKPIRVLAVWSKKLEALGLWYDQLLAESLGKQGQGPTPITAVETRDLHSRGQQHQEGTRDKLITNLIVKSPRSTPIALGMADRDEDELNQFSRKTYPDLMQAALQGTNAAYLEAARPTADLIIPSLSEYTMGQLMQMLMLATVVEGRLMGINPYGQPGVESYKRQMMAALKADAPPRDG